MKRNLRILSGLLTLLFLFSACGGGGNGGTTPPPSGGQGDTGLAFSVVVTAEPEQGPAPLTVAFSAYAFGGKAPYRFEWDFNGDGVSDSTETNPFKTFNSSTIVKLTVTDANNKVVVVQRSITITATEPPGQTPPLTVQFTASVSAGTAPLEVTFEAAVTGGSPPYIYRWDLDGDGITDSSSPKVVWTYTSPGRPTDVGGSTEYYYYPSLTVVDNRGIQRSTLDDTNGDGRPDWQVIINVVPRGQLSPSIRANPVAGQAPLPVEFTAGASGGQSPYMFRWDFGDGVTTDWSLNSFAQHIYESTGQYLAHVYVRDAQMVEEVSGAAVINVFPAPVLTVTISADQTSGAAPFKVEPKAFITGAREPITYNWQVFTDVTPTLDNPSIVSPPRVPQPYLDSDAVIVPSQSNDATPTFVFGTYLGQEVRVDYDANGDGNVDANDVSGVGSPYVIRLTIKDANGVEAESNLLRITPVPPEPADAYLAFRGIKVGDSRWSLGWNADFTPRANSAVVTHRSGVVYLFGGEILSQNGEFQSVLGLTDSAWALNISGSDIGDPSQGYGYADGGWTQLNVLGYPPYPRDGMGNVIVSNPDFYGPPYSRVPSNDRNIIRGDNFIPRGSAAAALVHEPVDTNPAVPYGGEVPEPDGRLGIPVIYVFGGRDTSGNPLDIVQKYYPPGFGTEALPVDTDSNGDGEPDAQVTNNMVDIWSNRFQFHDWDLWPQEGDVINPPIVPDRPPREAGGGGGTGAVPLAPLPRPLYGSAAVTIESVGVFAPVWPESPFYYIFILGGIEQDEQGNEHVVPTMRWFDTRMPPPQRQEGQEPRPGDYSPVVDMPIERAYHKAFVIPPDLGSNRPWQIVVIGGYDRNGNYIAQVDKFTFNSIKSPTTGTWTTVGYLPEAAIGHGAGWEFENPGRGFLYRQFAGRTVDGYTSSIIEIQDDGSVSYAPHTLLPRAWFGFGQVVRDIGSTTRYEYFMLSGVGEQGMNTIIERYRRP